MPQTLIIGDIHAMYDRLIETLENARFNPEEDTLYAVGDFCDRGPDPVKVIDYLMGLPHFLPVAGNHDMWLYEYLCGQGPAPIWLDPRNGGSVTYQAFRDLPEERKTKIRTWLGDLPLVRTAGNNIILHAGPPSEVQDQATLIAQTRGLTLSKAYEEKLATGSYSPLVHGIVWDRTYIRAAAGWEHFKDTEDAQELGRRPFGTDMTIICGHTPMREILHSDRYHITCIDTGSFDPDGHITVINLPA
ncbi:MAG: serine/threonine protein phosphatase [Firmicutes bacterium]|nr:serine/threonine protein phosphatase [Bacillota bacterium]